MKALVSLLLFLCGFSLFAQDVYVRGYYRANGTYVAPHYRTAPNSTVNDNYSTIGNINPHTGEAGTKPRDVYIPTYNSLPTYTTPEPQYNHYPAEEIADLEVPIDQNSVEILSELNDKSNISWDSGELPEPNPAYSEQYNKFLTDGQSSSTFDDFKDDRVAFKDYSYTTPPPVEQPQKEANENSIGSEVGIIFMGLFATFLFFANRR